MAFFLWQFNSINKYSNISIFYSKTGKFVLTMLKI